MNKRTDEAPEQFLIMKEDKQKQLLDSMHTTIWIGLIVILMGVITVFLLGIVKAVELIL